MNYTEKKNNKIKKTYIKFKNKQNKLYKWIKHIQIKMKSTTLNSRKFL